MSLRASSLLPLMLLAWGAPTAAQALFTGNARVAGDASAGQAVYAQSCLACHGPRLEGSPFAPALAGQAFVDRWRGKPSARLLEQMRETMPPKGTGTVKAEAFPDLLAYLVRSNVQGVPAPAGPGVTTAAPAAVTAKVSAPTPLPPEVSMRLAALTPVSESLLASPPDADWLMWRRTFDAAGFSPLKQIDRGNVQRLQVAWTLPLDRSANEIAPLVHEGVLFIYSGTSVQAVDAATGKSLWRFAREIVRSSAMPTQFDPSQRARVKSAALHGHTLFVPTPDGHLVALDARTGTLLWDKALNGDGGVGLQLSAGPVVARGVVVIGASLGLSNKGGCYIVGLDGATGQERWRFHTIARPGTPGGDTWNDAPADERFGGGVWTTGSYDPSLNLVYFGVGNTYNTATLLEPQPGASRVTRNDALYTNATLALRPETGELVWHHQHHVRDVWDQDWAFEQTLVTLGTGASARRAVVTSGKTGVFEAVDAATGQFLFAHDTGFQNVFLAVDRATGAKQPNPALEPVAGKTLLLCPSNFGARNWPATSLDPSTGLLFVPMLESCADFTYEPRGRKETARGGSDIRFLPRPRPQGDGNLGRMMVLDLAKQQVKWVHRQRMPVAGSLLATAGGLVFMGDLERNFGAYDQNDGALLWRTKLPAAAESTPITYAANGRQFVAVVSGEGSHLGVNNRKLVPELGDPNNDISLVVYALP